MIGYRLIKIYRVTRPLRKRKISNAYPRNLDEASLTGPSIFLILFNGLEFLDEMIEFVV